MTERVQVVCQFCGHKWRVTVRWLYATKCPKCKECDYDLA